MGFSRANLGKLLKVKGGGGGGSRTTSRSINSVTYWLYESINPKKPQESHGSSTKAAQQICMRKASQLVYFLWCWTEQHTQSSAPWWHFRWITDPECHGAEIFWERFSIMWWFSILLPTTREWSCFCDHKRVIRPERARLSKNQEFWAQSIAFCHL